MIKKTTLTKRQRLNRNLVIVMLLLGAMIGIAINLLGPQDSDVSFRGLSNIAISPLKAIILTIFWGIILPIMTYIWYQKSIDEQEATAYRAGAFYAANAYIGIVPIWWILWRGGLAPELNGMVIFIMFNSIWLATWIWKRYRG